MKLACAFEMLYARDPCIHDEPACFPPRAGIISENRTWESGRAASEGWNRYESSLVRNGYYKGELEGSALYRDLRDKVSLGGLELQTSQHVNLEIYRESRHRVSWSSKHDETKGP